MDESKERLERDLAEAFKALSNAGGRSAQGAENFYGQTYQRLVRAGYRPQMRHKYRTQKG